MGDTRLVVVGNDVFHLKNCKTFHDFLLRYITTIFGTEWWRDQDKTQGKHRHTLLKWRDLAMKQLTQGRTGLAADVVHNIPFTGALSAYMHLSHNLYLLAHNVELQQTLLARLKNSNPSSFHGAYYETFVAASFIKAGFELNLEKEDDSSTSHCEFTAKFKKTGNSFSVEAKSRYRDVDEAKTTSKLGVRSKLNAALKKHAPHTRVVFIDVNIPEIVTGQAPPAWAMNAIAELREAERLATEEDPRAYVIVTNQPVLFNLNAEAKYSGTGFGEGFKIPDFKNDSQFPSLLDAIDSRDAHIEMWSLLESMQKHSAIPATFDGQFADLAFAPKSPIDPVKIGKEIRVDYEDGSSKIGILEDAVVTNRTTTCIVRLPSGERVISDRPMSDAELAAYNEHPDTFFGAVKRTVRKPRDAIEWFDEMYSVYKDTSKDLLLDWMKDSPNIAAYQTMSQFELARRYCEGMVYSILRRDQQRPK